MEPTIEKGNKEFIDWLGGAFEINWSVNPHWDANFKELPKHPISSGVKPFVTNDEWYFHMRFRPGMKGVTPILSDVAPDSTMSRPDGHHSGNPAVREEVKNKVPQHVAWAVQRDDGGRGFGFTGGHFHAGWKNDDQRKLVLNAILWTAKMDVPEEGVKSAVTEEDMKANLDLKPGQGLPEKPKGAAKKEKAAAPKAAATPAPSRGEAPLQEGDQQGGRRGGCEGGPEGREGTLSRGARGARWHFVRLDGLGRTDTRHGRRQAHQAHRPEDEAVHQRVRRRGHQQELQGRRDGHRRLRARPESKDACSASERIRLP